MTMLDIKTAQLMVVYIKSDSKWFIELLMTSN